MEVWCVYGLRSELDGGFYVGMSSDVKKRVEYHKRLQPIDSIEDAIRTCLY